MVVVFFLHPFRGLQWLFDSIIHKSRGGCGEKKPKKAWGTLSQDRLRTEDCKILLVWTWNYATWFATFLEPENLCDESREKSHGPFFCAVPFFFWVATIFFFSASGFGKNDDAIVMQQLHFVCFAEVISWESKDGITLMPRFLGPKIRRGHKGRQLISWQKTWPFWGRGEPLQVPWILKKHMEKRRCLDCQLAKRWTHQPNKGGWFSKTKICQKKNSNDTLCCATCIIHTLHCFGKAWETWVAILRNCPSVQ